MKVFNCFSYPFLVAISLFFLSCEDDKFEDEHLDIIEIKKTDTQVVVTTIIDTIIENKTVSSRTIFSKPNSSNGKDASVVINSSENFFLNIDQNFNFNGEEILLSSTFENESKILSTLNEQSLEITFCDCNHIGDSNNLTINILQDETLCILNGEYTGTINGLNNNTTTVFIAENATFNPKSTSTATYSINSRVINFGHVILDNPYRLWTQSRVYNNGQIETFGGTSANNIVFLHHNMQHLENDIDGEITFNMASEGTSIRNIIDTVINRGTILNTRNNIAEPSLRYGEIYNSGEIQMSESLDNPNDVLESGVFFSGNMENYGLIKVQDLAIKSNSSFNNYCTVTAAKSMVMNGRNSTYNNFDYTFVNRALTLSGNDITLDLKVNSRFEVNVDGSSSDENVNIIGTGIFAFSRDDFVKNNFNNALGPNVDVRIPSTLIGVQSDDTCLPIDSNQSTNISWRSFIHFEAINSIPENSIIDSAFIRLYGVQNIQENTDITLLRVMEQWLEEEITWATQPNVDNSIQNGIIKADVSSNSLKIDVTELVKAMRQKEGFGFRIEQALLSFDNPFMFYSSNSRNQITHPEIFIRYHIVEE